MAHLMQRGSRVLSFWLIIIFPRKMRRRTVTFCAKPRDYSCNLELQFLFTLKGVMNKWTLSPKCATAQARICHAAQKAANNKAATNKWWCVDDGVKRKGRASLIMGMLVHRLLRSAGGHIQTSQTLSSVLCTTCGFVRVMGVVSVASVLLWHAQHV